VWLAGLSLEVRGVLNDEALSSAQGSRLTPSSAKEKKDGRLAGCPSFFLNVAAF
jgi:hypothetical protein